MANQDFNFDGVVDAFDDYAMTITCVDHSFVVPQADRGLYCATHNLTTPKFLELQNLYQINLITPYFPKGMPTDAIDEGQGLGYYVVNNECFSAWGNPCIPQQMTHFIQNTATPSDYVVPVGYWQVFGVALAFYVAIVFIKAFALRGAHA